MSTPSAIVILGAGVVALYTASQLSRRMKDTPIIVIGPKQLRTSQRDLFINHIHLEHILSLSADDTIALASVSQIDLAIDDLEERIHFYSDDTSHLGPWGYGAVISASALREYLYRQVGKLANIELIDQGLEAVRIRRLGGRWQLQSPECDPNPSWLLVTDPKPLPANLSERAISGRFQQTALSGAFRSDKRWRRCAWQQFLDTGPIAVLPLPEAGKYSFIWSIDQASADTITPLEPDDKRDLLQDKLSARMGTISEIQFYPSTNLTWRYYRRLCYNNMVLLGDVARRVHPMAGIGANLGLYSGWRFAQLLASEYPNPRPSMKSWEREVGSYGQLIHFALHNIRRLSPLLNPERKCSTVIFALARVAIEALNTSRGLRNTISAFATRGLCHSRRDSGQ